LLNASSERSYNFGFQGNLTFFQITTDGGLLAAPVPLTRLELAPGERAEILVNFSGMLGQTVYLISFSSEFPNGIYGATNPSALMGTIAGYSSNPLNGSDFNILALQVVAQTNNPITVIPVSLTTVTSWTNPSITRNLTIEPQVMGPSTMLNGPFQFNPSPFNMNTVNYTPNFNAVEVWNIDNQTAIAHPFHIHDVQFYILDINGSPPPTNMQGRKDVVLIPSQQNVRIITKFETFCDSVPYMYHCHMLPHEDDGLMGQFVVSCATSVNETYERDEVFTLYPNPSDGIFALYTDDKIDVAKITIFNILGEIIFTQQTTSAETIINLSGLSKGIYVVILKTSEDSIFQRLIID